jgi:DNA topoisomerase-1
VSTDALLCYLDDQPGITRRKCGRGYRYIAPDGTSIDAQEKRDRLKALAVPPAWGVGGLASPHTSGPLTKRA